MRTPFFHLVVWGLIAAAALSLYGYWYAVISEKSVAVAELQGKINAKTETASRIASARAALSDIADDEAAVQGYFVPETGVVPFISDLERRARAQSASLKVLSVATAGGAKQPALVLSLAVEGSFDAVMRTVGAIEFAPYDLVISKFSMGENGKGVWSASFEITVGSTPAAAATSTQNAPVKAPPLSHV